MISHTFAPASYKLALPVFVTATLFAFLSYGQPVKPTQEVAAYPTSLAKLNPDIQQKEDLKKAIPNQIQKEEKPRVESKRKVDIVGNANLAHNNAQIIETDKPNITSYVWIGIILIVLGIVLGMLFGRTAFLLSFIGVVFILLGIFIF